MTDIFVDGVRAVAVANGVARIELLQLKRGADATKLESQVVATLLIPVAGLRDLAAHLTSSMERIEANQSAAASDAANKSGDVETALRNL
jgi:hypothetical protein